MGTLTIRNLPDEVHDKLRLRAAKNRSSVEALVREMIEKHVAVEPAADWRGEIADIQARSRKAFGDPAPGEAKRFVRERRASWPDE